MGRGFEPHPPHSIVCRARGRTRVSVVIAGPPWTPPDGDLPPYPSHRHNAAEHPVDCLDAVLHELASAELADRAETLAHGLEALCALEQQMTEARRRARGYEHGMFVNVDTHAPGSG